MRSIFQLAIVLCAAAGPFTAAADTVTLFSAKDNTLYEDPDGALSNGAGTAMFAGNNAQGSNTIRRAVLAFDVAAALPAGATITSASLSLTNSANNAEPETIALHRLLADWGEGSSVAGGGQGGGAAATAGDATWIHRNFNTTFWSSAGGDFASAISATALVSGPGAYAWSSSDLASDVQSFLDAPAGNFGWIVIGNEASAGTAKKFATHEFGTAASRPQLTIEYAVPEPASIMLVALAAGILMHRSRG